MNQTTSTLLPLALIPLPPGEIRPMGWLLEQLRLQANGLSGHIDEFWPDVKNSRWIGGDAPDLERGPLWLDGIIPLAFLLEDDRLIAKARRWIDYIIKHQQTDGWIGPRPQRGAKRDPWPVFIALKALTQWADAADDARIAPVVERALRALDAEIESRPLQSWAWFRWGELLLSIYWLHDRTGESWPLSFAEKIHRQGFDWRGLFEKYPHRQKTIRRDGEETCTSTHGVNNAIAVKSSALWHRQSHDPADRRAGHDMIRLLDEYHGQITGMFSCDSHLAGKDPSQGAELCAVVEYQFSLQVMLSILGEGVFADRLERIAFNALPAMFTDDMWAHQFVQQVNQVICQRDGGHVYTDSGPDGNLFGLEPNAGCCAARMHQGWPKFAAGMWMKTPDGGLAAIFYCPCEVQTKLPAGNVTVRVSGSYPFHSARIIIETSDWIRFPLLLRVPEWAAKPCYRLNDGPLTPMTPINGFHHIDGSWTGISEIEVTFGKRFDIERRFNGSAAIVRGPVVMALPVEANWRRADETRNTNWEVLPTTTWNYGLCLDEKLQEHLGKIEMGEVLKNPFSAKTPSLRFTVPARRVSKWKLQNNAAGEIPTGAVSLVEDVEEITLIPYGCTHLRVTEFPVVEIQRENKPTAE